MIPLPGQTTTVQASAVHEKLRAARAAAAGLGVAREPRGWLRGVVGGRVALATTPEVAVLVHSLHAFPGGLSLTVELHARDERARRDLTVNPARCPEDEDLGALPVAVAEGEDAPATIHDVPALQRPLPLCKPGPDLAITRSQS
jgi:hypothetical protein